MLLKYNFSLRSSTKCEIMCKSKWKFLFIYLYLYFSYSWWVDGGDDVDDVGCGGDDDFIFIFCSHRLSQTSFNHRKIHSSICCIIFFFARSLSLFTHHNQASIQKNPQKIFFPFFHSCAFVFTVLLTYKNIQLSLVCLQ